MTYTSRLNWVLGFCCSFKSAKINRFLLKSFSGECSGESGIPFLLGLFVEMIMSSKPTTFLHLRWLLAPLPCLAVTRPSALLLNLCVEQSVEETSPSNCITVFH